MASHRLTSEFLTVPLQQISKGKELCNEWHEWKLIVDALFCGRVDVSHSKGNSWNSTKTWWIIHLYIHFVETPPGFGRTFSRSERALTLEAVVDHYSTCRTCTKILQNAYESPRMLLWCAQVHYLEISQTGRAVVVVDIYRSDVFPRLQHIKTRLG